MHRRIELKDHLTTEELKRPLDEVQEVLGHRNRSTTRVYVQRITRKRDKHSRKISERLKKSRVNIC
ncbi:MAG: hypothetical protein AUG51_02740 [Acidobacteria bacterium 13_1_20CM_3_53_8]|nr:MAG: hypothetical protein AUG51_02740 [Acidobacteria bacterium 13_1_20CM_3_53_8]